jgi:3-hydroxybutyryl-CoA dehydrogenase
MTSTIGVIGSGTMGSGIAELAALAGFDVILNDISSDALRSAMLRIKAELQKSVEKGETTAIEATETLTHIRPRHAFNDLGAADVIIEAVAEDLPMKKDIFRRLDLIVAPGAILATNTSSLSVSDIAATTNTPDSVVGMHFFNPPTRMKLVEIVRGAQTSDETISKVRELALAMGKTPVFCRDTPGFIVNRVARLFYGEALRLLGEGVAEVPEIDRIVRESCGFRMGPFELMDLIGIDVNYAVTRSVYEQFSREPRFEPHPIQRRMVRAGTLGRKTKKGFYPYD